MHVTELSPQATGLQSQFLLARPVKTLTGSSLFTLFQTGSVSGS